MMGPSIRRFRWQGYREQRDGLTRDGVTCVIGEARRQRGWGLDRPMTFGPGPTNQTLRLQFPDREHLMSCPHPLPLYPSFLSFSRILLARLDLFLCILLAISFAAARKNLERAHLVGLENFQVISVLAFWALGFCYKREQFPWIYLVEYEPELVLQGRLLESNTSIFKGGCTPISLKSWCEKSYAAHYQSSNISQIWGHLTLN